MTDSPRRLRVGDRVTIAPRGKKQIWCAEFSRDGVHHRQSLKTRNQKIAVQRAVKLDAELGSGKHPLPNPAGRTTVRQAVEDYLAYLETEGRARKTVVRYRGELTALCDFLEAHRASRLVQVTPLLFDHFRAARKQDHSARTLYHEAVVAKQFFEWCRTRTLLAVSPLLDYKLSKPVHEPKGGPSLAQVDHLLAASREPRATQLAVLAFTGMRAGQLRLLRPADVDLEAGWITIQPVEGAKTKRRVRVPIHSRLKALLQRRPATS